MTEMSKTKIISVAVATIIGFKIIRQLYRQYVQNRNVPGPKGLPLFGTLFNALKNTTRRHYVFAEGERRYGPLYRSFVGARRIYVVSDSTMGESVFKNTTVFPERPLSAMRYVRPFGLLGLPTGPMWKNHRTNLSALFTDDFLKKYFSVMTKNATSLVEKYKADGFTNDFHADMADLTMDILLQSVMGMTKADMTSGNKLLWTRDQMDSVLHLVSYLTPLPPVLWSIMPVPHRKKAERFIRNMNMRVGEYLDAPKLNHHSMLDYMRDLPNWSRREMIDEAMVFMAAGHETTANTLTFTFLLLATHPDVQQRVYEEIVSVQKKSPEGTLQFESLSQLKLTSAVFKEALRLYPTVPFTARRTAEPFTLTAPNGVTVNLEPEDTIIINVFSEGTNATVYKDPYAFKPERWLSDTPPATPHNFGGGQRQCIGKRFAEEEGVLVLAVLLSQVKVLNEVSGVKWMEDGRAETRYGVTMTLASRLGLKFQKRIN